MTINQLKYFITAAECLNFTQAGKQHYISQTAITQHIQALEEQLNAKLFIRKKRKVELTPAGKVFLEEARAILERTRIAFERTEKAATGEIGSIKIGYVKGYENSNFGSIIKEYHEIYPNIDFHLSRRAHLDLLHELENEKLDIAFNICYSDTNLENLEKMTLTKYRLYAVLYPSHPYAQHNSIKRYDLKNEKFFLTKFYDNAVEKHYEIPEMYAQSGFIPNVIGTSSDFETLFLLISAGMGISIMPESALKYVKQSPDLVFIPLEGEHEFIDMIALWNKNNTNPALHKLIQLLSEKYT